MWFKQIKIVKEKNHLNEKFGETEKSVKWKIEPIFPFN